MGVYPGLKPPMISGIDVVGTVESTTSNAFKVCTVASFTNVPKVPGHYQYFQNLLCRNLQNMQFF